MDERPMIGRSMPAQVEEAHRPAVVELQPHDDMASLRRYLDQVDQDRVALRLPWDLHLLSRDLDYDLLRREAWRRHTQVAIVSPDPARRQLARGCGFPVFSTTEAALSARRWNGHRPDVADPPPSYWWQAEPDVRPRLSRRRPTWMAWVRDGVRFAAFLLVIVAVAGSAYALLPHAEISLVPAGEMVTARVPISVDPEIESVTVNEDGIGGLIPSRRVGLEVEGHAEVATTETASVASGHATGHVLFTSRLAQDYMVPAGTVVRTSSTSYPIRFRTTADVIVPAEGQATAPIRALDERTGNVGAFQINRVEGVPASAVRVINPSPTTGAEQKEVPVVVQEDYDRVRQQLTETLLDKAYADLQTLLEADEFLPYPSLRVEAVPKKAYTHFIGEQAERVGLNMRLLVSGQAVNAGHARQITRQALVDAMPSGYRLVEASFQVGGMADEEQGPGWFTFYMEGRGYAAAAVGEGEVVARVRGRRVPEARRELVRTFPLAEPPDLETWPEWPDWLAFLDRMPLLPLRTEVEITPRSGVVAALQD
jgi:hypothetical protein